MPKAYRKPHISMNRKKYGNTVRPVRQAKAKVKLKKPQILGLKRIYAKLKKSASWQQLGILAEAIQWYRGALNYLQQLRTLDLRMSPVDFKKTLAYSAPTARAILAFNDAHNNLLSSTSLNFKRQYSIECLNNAQKVCIAGGIRTPDVQPYLKKGKVVAKKLDAAITKASGKYDKILTLMTQAMNSSYTLQIAPKQAETYRIDNELKSIFYSLPAIRQAAFTLRKEGLLAVVVSHARYLARAQSYYGIGDGLFTFDEQKFFGNYWSILQSFVTWARESPDAPKNILRKVKKVKVAK